MARAEAFWTKSSRLPTTDREKEGFHDIPENASQAIDGSAKRAPRRRRLRRRTKRIRDGHGRPGHTHFPGGRSLSLAAGQKPGVDDRRLLPGAQRHHGGPGRTDGGQLGGIAAVPSVTAKYAWFMAGEARNVDQPVDVSDDVYFGGGVQFQSSAGFETSINKGSAIDIAGASGKLYNDFLVILVTTSMNFSAVSPNVVSGKFFFEVTSSVTVNGNLPDSDPSSVCLWHINTGGSVNGFGGAGVFEDLAPLGIMIPPSGVVPPPSHSRLGDHSSHSCHGCEQPHRIQKTKGLTYMHAKRKR